MCCCPDPSSSGCRPWKERRSYLELPLPTSQLESSVCLLSGLEWRADFQLYLVWSCHSLHTQVRVRCFQGQSRGKVRALGKWLWAEEPAPCWLRALLWERCRWCLPQGSGGAVGAVGAVAAETVPHECLLTFPASLTFELWNNCNQRGQIKIRLGMQCIRRITIRHWLTWVKANFSYKDVVF